MARYNKTFELSVDDIDLIENALRRNKAELTKKQDAVDEATAARQIHELLGRLHNQKVFYRPKTGAYVGG